MRHTTKALGLALLAIAAGARAQQPGAPSSSPKPGVAVWDFDIGLGLGANHETAQDYEALRRGLAALTLNELTANPNIRVVERAQLQQILQEQNLGREGRVDPATAARVGRLIGAGCAVTGTFFDNHGRVKITARVIDSETGAVLHTGDVSGTMDNLYDLVPRLARDVMTECPNLPRMDRSAADQFRQANPPPPTQAVMAYSRAVLYADRGDTQRAVEQYRHALEIFPQYTQARTACNTIQSGACPAG